MKGNEALTPFCASFSEEQSVALPAVRTVALGHAVSHVAGGLQVPVGVMVPALEPGAF